MRRWTGLALVQIMACHLDGAKPLSEPMLAYSWLDPKEHILIKFYLKFKYFHSRKCVWICRLRNGGHFVQGGDELIWRCRLTSIHIRKIRRFYHRLIFKMEITVLIRRPLVMYVQHNKEEQNYVDMFWFLCKSMGGLIGGSNYASVDSRKYGKQGRWAERIYSSR